MEEENGQGEQRAVPEGVMTDTDLDEALEKLSSNPDTQEVAELLKMMNENRIISWEEAEQIMSDQGPSGVVKCGLAETKRPSEPENETNVEKCVSRLQQNDPELMEINLNNMKKTPIPQIQRMLMAMKDNTNLKKLSLANTGLSDSGAEPLLEVLENNTTLAAINLETNYLTGEFLARLFRAALKNQTLEEVKAVNQSEREIIDAIVENRGLLKVSIQLRMPEGRHKIENALIRNGDIRRQLRKREKEMAAAEPTA